MFPDRLLGLRLSSHGLGSRLFSSESAMIQHYGAIQAQVYRQACWSFGTRLPSATLESLEDAINQKMIVRLRPMRGTLHLVDPSLVTAFLDLCASKTLKSFSKRRAYLGISDEEAGYALKIIQSVLTGGKALTRQELEDALITSGIEKKKQRIYHLTCYAATSQLICFGPKQGSEDTFVLLNERLSGIEQVPSDDLGRAAIARCYFRGHGPATVHDLSWWTGWNKTESTHALSLIEGELTSSEWEKQKYYWTKETVTQTPSGTVVIPGFDEYFLGYKDRTSLAPKEKHKHYFSSNGIFSPLVLVGGKVVGTWKYRMTSKKLIIHYTQRETDYPLDEQELLSQGKKIALFRGKEHLRIEVIESP